MALADTARLEPGRVDLAAGLPAEQEAQLAQHHSGVGPEPDQAEPLLLAAQNIVVHPDDPGMLKDNGSHEKSPLSIRLLFSSYVELFLARGGVILHCTTHSIWNS